MVIYDVECTGGHRFEGWFKNLASCEEQVASGLVECPQCGTTNVTRQLTGSAIRRSAEDRAGTVLPVVPAGASATPPAAAVQASAAPQQGTAAPESAPTPEQVREFLGVLGAVLRANSDDVGNRFAEEARRIHRGDAPERLIRGTTTPEEEDALEAEDIPFVKVPLVGVDD